jgi:hypothetical protein
VGRDWLGTGCPGTSPGPAHEPLSSSSVALGRGRRQETLTSLERMQALVFTLSTYKADLCDFIDWTFAFASEKHGQLQGFLITANTGLPPDVTVVVQSPRIPLLSQPWVRAPIRLHKRGSLRPGGKGCCLPSSWISWCRLLRLVPGLVRDESCPVTARGLTMVQEASVHSLALPLGLARTLVLLKPGS